MVRQMSGRDVSEGANRERIPARYAAMHPRTVRQILEECYGRFAHSVEFLDVAAPRALIGGCDGNVARWCVDGVAKGRDCSCLDQLCTVDGTLGGAACIDDPCMGLDFLGQCNGDVAEWCDGGALAMQDCAEMGQTCGFVNDEIGYYCM